MNARRVGRLTPLGEAKRRSEYARRGLYRALEAYSRGTGSADDVAAMKAIFIDAHNVFMAAIDAFTPPDSSLPSDFREAPLAASMGAPLSRL